MSNLLFVAQKLGRTVQEMLFGNEHYTPISVAEYNLWLANEDLKADRIEAARNKKSRS